MRMTLDLVKQLPDVETVNLGGGFKVGRMPREPTVDIREVGAHVRGELEAFVIDMVAHSVLRLSRARTWSRRRAPSWRPALMSWTPAGDGYLFAKLDTGND
jgi:diaminopimelate decarboxylase